MLLEIKNLDVYYEKSYILRKVNLTVNKGEIVALFGRNGAGKTTTLKSVIGLKSHEDGDILFEGNEISKLAPYQKARLGIGYIPQEKLLFGKMTVHENLLSSMRETKNDGNLKIILELFPALENKLSRKASLLSGGEQQMLAIARALVTKPKLLLIDEPSTGLMPSMISRLGEIIVELRNRGMSILIVEEKIPFVLNLADRFYVMDVGQIVYSDLAINVKAEDLIDRYLGAGKLK